MTMITVQGQERYLHALLKENLDNLRKKVEKNWDGIIYIGGYEGDGKSWLAAQIAAYLDPTYSLDRCTFSPQQFIKSVDDQNEYYKAIVWDEAQDAVDSGASRDSIARTIKSKLSRIRRKRLFIIICAPDYWRINRYLFIHRSIAFLLVYADGLERGHFAFYSRPKKHQLYVKGKKEENPHVVIPDFRGDFGAWFPLDEASYDAKKEEAERQVTIETVDDRMTKEFEKGRRFGLVKMYMLLKGNHWLKPREIAGAEAAAAKYIGISPRRLRDLVLDLKQNELIPLDREAFAAGGVALDDDRKGGEETL